MAEQLESFDFDKKRTKGDWVNWTNGRVWKVIKGQDFQSTADSSKTGLYVKARELKMSVSISMDVDTVVFQFIGQGPLAKLVGMREKLGSDPEVLAVVEELAKLI